MQHPPEASVKIHQVLKVKTNTQPVLRMLSSSSSSGSAGAPAPAGVDVQAQTLKGDGAFAQQSGFKYCFREVKDGQVRRTITYTSSSPLGKQESFQRPLEAALPYNHHGTV